MATKIIPSDEDIEKMNALSKQYNDDYNVKYQEFIEVMKPITEKFETDVSNIFELL